MRKSVASLISLLFLLFIGSFVYAQGPVKQEAKAKQPVTKEAPKTPEVKANEPARAPEPSANAQAETAASTEEIQVEDAQIATAIENKAPTGAGTEFTKDTSKLYCWTKVASPSGETSIKHVWYHNDKVASEVELAIKDKRWRTYSSKTIMPYMTGDWKVDITTKDGKVLKTVTFAVK